MEDILVLIVDLEFSPIERTVDAFSVCLLAYPSMILSRKSQVNQKGKEKNEGERVKRNRNCSSQQQAVIIFVQLNYTVVVEMNRQNH